VWIAYGFSKELDYYSAVEIGAPVMIEETWKIASVEMRFDSRDLREYK